MLLRTGWCCRGGSVIVSPTPSGSPAGPTLRQVAPASWGSCSQAEALKKHKSCGCSLPGLNAWQLEPIRSSIAGNLQRPQGRALSVSVSERRWAPASGGVPQARRSGGPGWTTGVITGLTSGRVEHRRHPTQAAAASAAEFFQSDVVQYGSRYTRPDRFPRLRQASAGARAVDVQVWLQEWVRRAEAVGVYPEGALVVPLQCEQAVEEGDKAGLALADRLRGMVLQGRLEEAYEQCRDDTTAKRIIKEQPFCKDSPGTSLLHHSCMLLAAVDSGDIALAFEYAGLLLPTPDVYNLLMAAYAVRGDYSAVQLGLNTAKRRGIAPNALSYSLVLLAAASVTEPHKDEAQVWYDEAEGVGLHPFGPFEHAWSALLDIAK